MPFNGFRVSSRPGSGAGGGDSPSLSPSSSDGDAGWGCLLSFCTCFCAACGLLEWCDLCAFFASRSAFRRSLRFSCPFRERPSFPRFAGSISQISIWSFAIAWSNVLNSLIKSYAYLQIVPAAPLAAWGRRIVVGAWCRGKMDGAKKKFEGRSVSAGSPT